jgi:hypothetical protein
MRTSLDGLFDAAIDKVGAPEDIEDVLFHVGPRDESQGVGYVPDLVSREPYPTEELLFRVNGGGRVVEAVLIAVREHAPFDPGDGRIAQDLSDPLPVGEGFAQTLRFDEQARLSQDRQRVVNRTILRGRLVLPVNLIRIADIPPQGLENGVDQRRLRVLFPQGAILILADLAHRVFDRFSQSIGFVIAHESLLRRTLFVSRVRVSWK